MELPTTRAGVPAGLSLSRLTRSYLDRAAALCDESVGKNLYSQAYLASILARPDHHFYLLTAPEGEIAGYIYFYLTGLDEMAALSKLPRSRLADLSVKERPVIGNLSSIGVAASWRRLRLSEYLIGFALEQLERLEADFAFGLGWKIGDYVPMEKTLRVFHFICLGEARRVWYDRPGLICPYCEGRCECAAAVYYKALCKEVPI